MSRPKKKPEWIKKRLKLREGHSWTAREGYQVFVADRGAVRFDVPRGWVIVPTETGSIKFHDKKPPDDDCTLQLTVMRLPPQIDWSGLPLGPLLKEVTKDDSREIFARGPVVEVRRPGLEIAWHEVKFLDPEAHRQAFSRTALARGAFIQPLLTFDYWADDAPKLVPVWDEVLRTLELGKYIRDPRLGR